MKVDYSEIFTEVNEVLKFTDPELTKKIPASFKSFIKKNMSKNYNFIIHNNDYNITLKQETKTILALIYRKYFCSSEEKKILQQTPPAFAEGAKYYSCPVQQ